MQRIAFLVFLLAVGCSSQNPGVQAPPHPSPEAYPQLPAEHVVEYPGDQWPTGDPALYGLDPIVLQQAADYSESIGGLCLLVIRDGKLVFESYTNGTTVDTTPGSWSIAKSFTSALIGIAIANGDIESVQTPVSEFVTEWQGTAKESITIEDVMAMRSGLGYSLLSDNLWTVFENDHTQHALSNSIDAPPNTVWHYSNKAVQVLDAVLETATGTDPEQYAIEHLWGPLGLREEVHWNRDDVGNTTMYMNVHAGCRDLARFGYLYLHEGRWDGKQIIPQQHVADTLTPQELNKAYGWLWWLNGDGPGISSTDEPIDGWMFDFAPADLFGAQGLGHNFIDVIPSSNTIYVHLRPAPQDPPSNLITDPFGTLEAMLEAGENIEHMELLQILLDADV